MDPQTVNVDIVRREVIARQVGESALRGPKNFRQANAHRAAPGVRQVIVM
jgi:hypothetical protein